MKMKIAAAITTIALGLGLFGCSSGSAYAEGSNYTIYDYITDDHIQRAFVHPGDPGSPVINLPVPAGWQLTVYTSWDRPEARYAGIALRQPADPDDPPTIVAYVTKLTGDVNPAKLIQYAPGELKNLPGYEGSNGGTSALGGFRASQISGSYTKVGKKRVIAQKTVVIPSQGAVFVLQLRADGPDSERGGLMDAANDVFDQTTITT
jgi:hypothetical protein